MYVKTCVEIIYRNIATKYYQRRLAEVHSVDPETVKLTGNDVFFHFCKLYFDFDYTEAGVSLAREAGQGHLLWDNERKELILPTKIEFMPEQYFVRARRVTREEANAGGLPEDTQAVHWMGIRGLTEAIRAVDGRYHRITPHTILLNQPVPA